MTANNHNEAEADDLRGTTPLQALTLLLCLLPALAWLALSVALHTRAVRWVACLALLLLLGCRSAYAPQRNPRPAMRGVAYAPTNSTIR